MDNSEISAIHNAINQAKVIAIPHYEFIALIQKKLEAQLDEFLYNKKFNELYSDVSKENKEWAKQIETLKNERNILFEGTKITQKEIFEEKYAKRNDFTVMLFGKTKAGKSTTIQAFLQKDLAIHGDKLK